MLRIHFIDVGYGDATLVEFPQGEIMLIDAGSKKYAEDLINYLKGLDIKKIDAAILTHPHYDHFEGFGQLVKEFPIEQFYFNDDPSHAHEGYDSILEEIRRHGIREKSIMRGDELFFSKGDVVVKILHPEDLSAAKSGNSNSVVAWIGFKETSFLLTSDIQPQQQSEILNIFPGIKGVDYIQIPHHGGKLSDDFVSICKDKGLVMSVGPNDYGRPYDEELKKLKGKILRTDHLGTIVVESDGKKVTVIK